MHSISPDHTKKWLQEEFTKKVVSIDWKAARRDVENFLSPSQRKFVESWNMKFFQKQIEKIEFVSK